MFILGFGRLSRLRSLSVGASCIRQTLRLARPIHQRRQASCPGPTNSLAVNAQLGGQSPKRDPGLATPSTRPAPPSPPGDLPVRQPPPPPRVGKAPIGKTPIPASRRSHARAKILALSSNDPSRVHDAGYVHRLPSSRCRGASALADCAHPRFIIRRSTRAPFQSSRRIIRRTIPPCPRLLPQSILSMMQRAPVR